MGIDYKDKSYKLLIMWIIGFLGLMIAGTIVPKIYFSKVTIEVMMKIMLMLVLLALLTLFYIIYKTENIYWINGTSYDEAKFATSERRKKFAVRHLKPFLKATAIYGVYCIIGIIINTSEWIDITTFILIIIIAAVKTIPIKL